MRCISTSLWTITLHSQKQSRTAIKSSTPAHSTTASCSGNGRPRRAGLSYVRPRKARFQRREPDCERYVISCDYGTVNPSSFGLWGLHRGIWYRIKEYYYSSRKEGASRTDEEHYAALEELAGDRSIERVVIDPSAASFIECIRRHGRFKAAKADNDVVAGIRRDGDALKREQAALP